MKSRTVWTAVIVGIMHVVYENLPEIQAAIPSAYMGIFTILGTGLTIYFRTNPQSPKPEEPAP
jgi:hypothetical protein